MTNIKQKLPFIRVPDYQTKKLNYAKELIRQNNEIIKLLQKILDTINGDDK